MAFSKSYLGDTKALALVLQTIEKKNAILPGITVKADLAGMVQANVAEWFYNVAPNVAEVDAGADFNTTQAGSKKAVLVLSRGLHIDEKIPNVAIETTSADVIYDRLVKGALALTNKLGAKFITDLKALAQAKTYTKGLDMYEAIVEAMGTFSQGASVKVGGVSDTTFSNATNGIQPTTVLVGDIGRAKLFKTDAFQRIINATGEIPGLIGEMLGLKVVYVQDLTDVDFIMLNAEGVAYPHSINTLRVIESENFNGVRVQGEVGYPDASAYAVLPIDSFAMKFTEAAA